MSVVRDIIDSGNNIVGCCSRVFALPKSHFSSKIAEKIETVFFQTEACMIRGSIKIVVGSTDPCQANNSKLADDVL